MQVAEILEARSLNRDIVRDINQFIHDDKEDKLLIRISADEAKALHPKFIDQFGFSSWNSEDESGLYTYNWEEWIPVDGGINRWFITLGWYIPSGRGMVKARKGYDSRVDEAIYHGNDFTTTLKQKLKDVKAEAFNQVEFETNIPYNTVISIMEKVIGETEWESYEYGAHDVPCWYLEDRSVMVTIEQDVNAKRKPYKYVTRVIIEYDPNGF